jgi:hyaluronoglucosaminidase
VAAPFLHRGVVEGFYGRPFVHADRTWLLDRMAGWGMNTYVYAPKDDPYHREQWRVPYPEAERAALGRLVEHGARHGIRVGLAIAPGLSIAYASAGDRETLLEKVADFVALGARFLCLALDDVPSRLVHAEDRARYASLAEAHVDLAHAVQGSLPADATLWLVPTDYAGTADSDYLRTLGTGLAPGIEVGWTGRSVVSPEIRLDEAAARARCLGRRLLVWDNYPVADGPMRNALHLGPYTGRAPDLHEHVSGVLLNPMELCRASTVALATASAYLRDPAGYDAESAWREAVQEAGAGSCEAFADFAAAHRFSALAPLDRDDAIESALGRLRTAIDEGAQPDARETVETLRRLLAARAGAPDTLREGLADRALLEEIEPWLRSHASETRKMQEAVDLLAVLVEEAPAMQVALAFFRMEGRMTRVDPASRVSYGPRRIVHPQLESLEDEGARFGDDPVLFVDHCLTEAVVRYAEGLALDRLGGRRGPSDRS